MASSAIEEAACNVLKQYQGQFFLTASGRSFLRHSVHKDYYEMDEITIEGIRLTPETQDLVARIRSDEEKTLQARADRNIRQVTQAMLIAGYDTEEMHPLAEIDRISKIDTDGTYTIRFRGIDLAAKLEKLGIEVDKSRLLKSSEQQGEPDMRNVVKLNPPPRREPNPHADDFEHAFLIPRGQGQSIV